MAETRGSRLRVDSQQVLEIEILWPLLLLLWRRWHDFWSQVGNGVLVEAFRRFRFPPRRQNRYERVEDSGHGGFFLEKIRDRHEEEKERVPETHGKAAEEPRKGVRRT